MELRLGGIEALHSGDGPFDKILTVNCAAFRDAPEQTSHSLRGRLTPGGRVAITFMLRRRGATHEDAMRTAYEGAHSVRGAGFSSVEIKTLDLNPVCAVCILATK